MSRVIAIQGFAPDSRDEINNEPESTEIWGLTNGYRHLTNPERATKWFQIHPHDWNSQKLLPPNEYGREEGHVEWLSKYEGELYMQWTDKRIPNAIMYPYREVVSFLGTERPYLTSSFAYALAFALWEHGQGKTVSKIKIFGINLTTSEEYFNQRPCVEFLLGVARGMGIEYELPRMTALLRGPEYARDGANDNFLSLRERAEYWRKEHQSKRDLLTSASYVLHELSTWISTFQKAEKDGMNVDPIATMSQRRSHVNKMANNLTGQVEGTAAAFREAQHALSTLGQMYIPRVEFPTLELAAAPIGYDRAQLQETDSDDRTRPDPAGVGTNAEPATAGAD